MERVGSAGKKVEKTKQREPNHHILGKVERDNTPRSPEGTQNRMKLMADNYEDDHLKASSNSDQSNHKPSPDQDDEEGIWA
ncbi:ELKS/Rab6-interacting/CAST family member 1 isoform X8 [Tachysurus ichikawai]